jgi:hypothetical protein
MKKIANDWDNWKKIFPEFEIQELDSNTSASLGNEQTIQMGNSSSILNGISLNNISLDTWNNWNSLDVSTMPSLTASDIYTIDFANIGSAATINLSALTTSASSAIWTGATVGGWPNSQGTVNIDTNGVHLPEGTDITIGNVSLTDRLDRIESRLAILKPNPELEKEFQELQELGDQYRALEEHIKEKLETFQVLKRE